MRGRLDGRWVDNLTEAKMYSTPYRRTASQEREARKATRDFCRPNAGKVSRITGLYVCPRLSTCRVVAGMAAAAVQPLQPLQHAAWSVSLGLAGWRRAH